MEALPGHDAWKTTPPEWWERDDYPPQKPLTFAQELVLQRAELEKQLPPTVFSTISGYAYEKGHFAGEQEVNQLFCELGELILSALKKDDLV